MLLGVQKSVKEWTLTLLSELPFWELESRWTPKFSESDYRGQNSMDWGVPYTIEFFLELRCLKWAHITIWTFETQVMTKVRARSQIANLTPNHWKSGITQISSCAGCVQHTVGKLSMRATTFFHTSFRSEVYMQSYGPPKSWES
jgi:hypothetical protein